jgi:protein transport protein SEC24
MGPMQNQSMTSVSSPSKIDLNQIPRPGSSSSPIVYETRVENKANPPPVCHITLILEITV